jgi:TonB family protein
VAVDVDASGKVTATKAASNTPAVMATLLDHAIRQWHFHPAMRSKVPQPVHTWVDVLMNVEKLPDGQGLVRVRYIDNGPRLVSGFTRPAYPRAEIRRHRAAILMVTGTVDPEGRLEDITVTSRFPGERVLHDFSASARAVAEQWRFDPVTVAGKPFPARVKLPITYMTGIPGGEQFVDHKQMLFLKKQE